MFVSASGQLPDLMILLLRLAAFTALEVAIVGMASICAAASAHCSGRVDRRDGGVPAVGRPGAGRDAGGVDAALLIRRGSERLQPPRTRSGPRPASRRRSAATRGRSGASALGLQPLPCRPAHGPGRRPGRFSGCRREGVDPARRGCALAARSGPAREGRGPVRQRGVVPNPRNIDPGRRGRGKSRRLTGRGRQRDDRGDRRQAMRPRISFRNVDAGPGVRARLRLRRCGRNRGRRRGRRRRRGHPRRVPVHHLPGAAALDPDVQIGEQQVVDLAVALTFTLARPSTNTKSPSARAFISSGSMPW